MRAPRQLGTPLWSVVVLFTLMVVVGVANLLFTTSQVDKLESQQRAACGFASIIGSVPFADTPKPSKLGVELVADSRDWWRQNGCTGPLQVPPGFAKWAAYYGLPPSLRR